MDHAFYCKLPDLAGADVPVLLVCGTIDPILQKFATKIEAVYQQYGDTIAGCKTAETGRSTFPSITVAALLLPGTLSRPPELCIPAGTRRIRWGPDYR